MSTILFIVLIVLRSIADMVQRKLGVLPQRFAGSGASNCSGHAFLTERLPA
jgi:hypothetical protein